MTHRGESSSFLFVATAMYTVFACCVTLQLGMFFLGSFGAVFVGETSRCVPDCFMLTFYFYICIPIVNRLTRVAGYFVRISGRRTFSVGHSPRLRLAPCNVVRVCCGGGESETPRWRPPRGWGGGQVPPERKHIAYEVRRLSSDPGLYV
jgi:hypothetical protein